MNPKKHGESDFADMDAMLAEQCGPLVQADLHHEQAALDQYVDAVLRLMAGNIADPTHRAAVINRAEYVMASLILEHGEDRSEFVNANQHWHLLNAFQLSLAEKLLDAHYGNARNTVDVASSKRKVNLSDMDALLIERFTPLVQATDDAERQAALEECVDAVHAIIALDGMNPRHRFDVLDMVPWILDAALRKHGRGHDRYNNHREKHVLNSIFQRRFIEKVLDEEQGNTLHADSPEIERRRNEMQARYAQVLNVDDDLLPATEEQQPAASPRRIASNEGEQYGFIS